MLMLFFTDHRQVFVGVHIPLRGRSNSRIERAPRNRGHHHHRRRKRKNGRGGDATDKGVKLFHNLFSFYVI